MCRGHLIIVRDTLAEERARREKGEGERERKRGKAQRVVLVGSCAVCGDVVATAVSTYAPLVLSCCSGLWTAVLPPRIDRPAKGLIYLPEERQ
jgi:hypothetical protein